MLQNAINQGDSVIKVKSLPYDACQLDVLHFFEGFRIRPNGVQLVIQGNNKPSGEVSIAPSDSSSGQASMSTCGLRSNISAEASCQYHWHMSPFCGALASEPHV